MEQARRRSGTETGLVAVGGLLLLLGVVAGLVNRQVLDAPTFAAAVDDARRRPEVSAVLGPELAAGVMGGRPDLVAVAPLIEAVSASVVGGELLSVPVRAAVGSFHGALTDGDGGQAILRIADAGALVATALDQVAPEVGIGAGVPLTLATIGGTSGLPALVGLVGVVGLAAWLLPTLAIAAFAAAALVGRRPVRTTGKVAIAAIAAAAGLAVALAVGGVWARSGDGSTVRGAFRAALWDELTPPAWRSVGLLVVLAALLATLHRAPDLAAGGAGRLARDLVSLPTTWRGRAGRGAAAIVVGTVVIVEPGRALTASAVAFGLAGVAWGLSEVTGAFGSRRTEAAERGAGRRPVPAVARWRAGAALGAVVLAVAMVSWAARSGRDAAALGPPAVVQGEGEVCNGHAVLCARRFDEVAHVSAHNAMAVAGAPGWFIGEHGVSIPEQLDLGTRALLIDVFYGQPAGRRVRTSARSYEEALAIAREELGPELSGAGERLAASLAVAEPTGPEGLFLCHGLCETGATSLPLMLGELRTWLEANPDEVVTLFMEDYVDAVDIAADIEAAGLAGYTATPGDDGRWPTLGEMTTSGRRLVVLLESGGRGGTTVPWLLDGFAQVQDTPYTFPTIESFSCAPNRGPADAPLFLLNHWLSGFSSLVSNAIAVNDRDVLGPRAAACRAERGQPPNFVAVNYVDIGDVVDVVDDLNGTS